MQQWYRWLHEQKKKEQEKNDKRSIRSWSTEWFPVQKEEQVSCTESRNQQLGEEVCKCWKNWSEMLSTCRDVKKKGKSGRSIGSATQ